MHDLLIATDEAGYGPNLGPLVIAATCWRVPHGSSLQQRSDAVLQAAAEWNGRHPAGAVCVGDSKTVYRQGKGLAALERTVLSAALPVVPVELPCDGRTLGRLLCPKLDLPQWLDGDSWGMLPSAESADHIESAKSFWSRLPRAEGIELLGIEVDIVFPREWNGLLERFGKKSTLLTHRTLHLARRIVEQHGAAPADRGNDIAGRACATQVELICDKHGGRNDYRTFLLDAFGDLLRSPWIGVEQEAGEASRYHLQGNACDLDVRFYCKAERWAFVGLSSIVAKYLREIAMASFNRFWRVHCPHVRPTAGYPVDARRFRDEVESARRRLGIPEDDFWRKK